MQCPHCNAENREDARFCTQCGGRLTPESPEESIDWGPYRSVFQSVHRLRHEEVDEVARQELTEDHLRHRTLASEKERSLAWSIILTLLTCGIYGFVWLYKIGDDLRMLSGKDEPHAGLDVFLTLVTCKVWDVYIAYRYPQLIDDIERRVGLPESHLSTVCVILALFGLWKVYGLGLINLALLQNELNKIWRSLNRS
ncbi:MAG: DUF4234 domain-containing protein [Acidobacteria bacterium]|nr:MAG: DUF4234 domain-containing protein [Acidobacteriota bacterium]